MHRITLSSILMLFAFIYHSKAIDSLSIDIPGVDKFQFLETSPLDFQSIATNNHDFTGFIQIGDRDSIFISISGTNVLAPNYHLSAPKNFVGERQFGTYAGISADGGTVRLTLADDFLYGYIETNKETYYIEPARYYSYDPDYESGVIIYMASDVDMSAAGTCAVKEVEQRRKSLSENNDRNHQRQTGNCYAVELAIASDYSMYQKYNSSITEVELHNIGVINNVNGDYTGSFADNIEFLIVTQFISDCSTCDPWTSSTNASSLLVDFSNWGQAGGFGIDFGLAELWTNRNLDGATVGLAWLNNVCTGFRYHLLQDFTSIAIFLRVLVSHEIGHNFSAGHDASGSPHIMAPTVQNTSSWSAASITSISDKIASLVSGGCFVACNSGTPPTSAFSVVETSVCEGETVQFVDESTDGPTTWYWSFPGGNPSSSTLQNPSVVYHSGGEFDVTLVTTNAHGTDTLSVADFMEINAVPEANFTFEVSNLTEVQFTNASLHGELYSWDFGNGQNSSLENPFMSYGIQNDYVVELSVVNECGTSEFSTVVGLGPCLQNMTLTGTIQSGAYVVGNSIIASGIIAPGAEVYFHAPNGITLGAGFDSELAGEILLTNNGCTN